MVVADLLQTEPMSFPANKTCLMGHIEVVCINPVRLIYGVFIFFILGLDRG